RCHQCRTEAAHVKATNDVGDNHQAQRAENPVENKVQHVVQPLRPLTSAPAWGSRPKQSTTASTAIIETKMNARWKSVAAGAVVIPPWIHIAIRSVTAPTATPMPRLICCATAKKLLAELIADFGMSTNASVLMLVNCIERESPCANNKITM